MIFGMTQKILRLEYPLSGYATAHTANNSSGCQRSQLKYIRVKRKKNWNELKFVMGFKGICLNFLLHLAIFS